MTGPFYTKEVNNFEKNILAKHERKGPLEDLTVE
jgi:hypothetical protein